MKIDSVTTFPVAYPEPNDNHSIRYLLFCRIESDDGAVGWGEGITQFPESTRAAEQIVQGMAPLIIGRDPMENIAIWRSLKASSWWYGYRGGVASFALSAIDVALWDLKGRLLGQPVVNLLGGAHRLRLPVIASTHAFDASLEFEAERHGSYVREQGYQGVKVGMGKHGDTRLGYEVSRDVAFVRLVRSAIGETAMLMLDRGQSLQWTLADAIRRCDAFEDYKLTWIEEPLEPTDVEGFRKLRPHVKCLIATGEREWTAHGFKQFMETGIVDVVGCDVGRAEGITGALKVLEHIEANDLWFNSHAWSSAINTAASLALSAITPRCLVQELKTDDSPMQQELVEEPLAQSGGWIDVPMKPGLGVSPRMDTLLKYKF